MSKLRDDLKLNLNLKKKQLAQFADELKKLITTISDLQKQHQTNTQTYKQGIESLGTAQKEIYRKDNVLPKSLDELKFKLSSEQTQLIDLKKQEIALTRQIDNLTQSIDSDTKFLQKADSEASTKIHMSEADNNKLKNDKLYQGLLEQLNAKTFSLSQKELQIKVAPSRGIDQEDHEDHDEYEQILAQQRQIIEEISELESRIVEHEKILLEENRSFSTMQPVTDTLKEAVDIKVENELNSTEKQNVERQKPVEKGPAESEANTEHQEKEAQLIEEQKLKEEKRLQDEKRIEDERKLEEDKGLKEAEKLNEAKRLEAAEKLKETKRLEDERKQKDEENKRKLEETAKKQADHEKMLKAQAQAAAKAQAEIAKAKAAQQAAALAAQQAAAAAAAQKTPHDLVKNWVVNNFIKPRK